MRSLSCRLSGGAVLAIVLAGCGGSPTAPSGTTESGGDNEAGQAQSVYDEFSAFTGQQRRDELVTCAEEEGQLSWYTSMSSGPADAISEGFQDTFDVELSLYRASSETVLQRILQEADANYQGSDVIENNAKEMSQLNAEGVFGDYESERRQLVPDVGQFPGWTATRFNIFTPAWNTDLIQDVGAPTSWEDLADPKYDGMLSMEAGDYDWYLGLYSYWQEQGKSDDEIDKLFADMADGAKITKGHSVQAELLSAGQYGLVASAYTNTIDRQKADGAPVDYRPVVEPLIARANGVGVMKTATHPCAAMLFTDWILEEGQVILAEESYAPSIPEGEDPLEGVELISVDIERLLTEDQEWSERYESVVAGGEVDK